MTNAIQDKQNSPKGTGEIEVLNRQILNDKDAALLQREGTKEFRLLSKGQFEDYIPEKSTALPARFIMKSADWGKCLKPESFGSIVGFGSEAKEAVDFALWRRGIVSKGDFANVSDIVLKAVGATIGNLVQRALRVKALAAKPKVE